MLCCSKKTKKKNRFKLFHIEKKQTREDEFKPKQFVLDLGIFEDVPSDLYLDQILTELKQNSSFGRILETPKYIGLKTNYNEKIAQIEQQVILNNQNYEEYPSDYTLCLISNHVYCFKEKFESAKLDEISGFTDHSTKRDSSNEYLFQKCSTIYQDDRLHANFVWQLLLEQNWIIYDVLRLTGYKSVLYLNAKTKQLVLAIQGFKFNSIGYLFSTHSKLYIQTLDKLILNHLLALVYHLKISIQLSDKLNYSLSFTGYSFGSLFADLCVYFSQRYFNKPQVRGVTFESVGSFNLLNRIDSNTIDLTKLNIRSYLYELNLVNSFEKHLGKLIYMPAWYALDKTSLKHFRDKLSLDETKRSLNSIGLKCLLLSFRNKVKNYEINNLISQTLNENNLLNQTKNELNQELVELIQDHNLVSEIPFAFVKNYLLNVLFQIFQPRKNSSSSRITSYSLIDSTIRSRVLDLDSNRFDKQLFIIKSLTKCNTSNDLLLKQLFNLKNIFKIELVSESIKLNSETSVQNLYKQLERLNEIYSNLDELIQNNAKNLFIFKYLLREKEKLASLTRVSNLIQFSLDLIRDQITLVKSDSGTGKLTYCLEYAKKRLQNESNLLVKLIDAKSAFSLMCDLYQFAKELRLESTNSTRLVDKIKNELNDLNLVNFLLIFKNIENFELIKEFFTDFNENIQIILIAEKDSNLLNDYEINRVSFDLFTVENYVELGKKTQIDDQDVALILQEVSDKNVYKLKSLFKTLVNCSEKNLSLEIIQKYYNEKFEIIKFNNLNSRELSKNFTRLEFIKKNNRLILDLLKYLSHLDGDYLNEELVKSLLVSIDETSTSSDFEYVMHGLKKYSILESVKMHKLAQRDALEYFRLNQNENVLIDKLVSSVFSLTRSEANKEIVFKQIFSLMNSSLVKNYLFYLELNLTKIESKLKSLDENLYEFLKPEMEKFKENLLKTKPKPTEKSPKETKLENSFSDDYKYMIKDFMIMKIMFNFAPQKVMICGDSGSGKTALCLKYAHLRSINESNFIVRLIDASTIEVLEYDLYKLASSLNANNSIREIREKFEELKTTNFLVIIENLEQNEIILARVSDLVFNLSANVKVLITTRNSYLQYKLAGFSFMNFYYNHEDYYKLFASYTSALERTFKSSNPKEYLMFIYDCKLEKENKPRGILKMKSFLNTLSNNPDWTKSDLRSYYKNSATKFSYIQEENKKAFEIFKYLTVLNPCYLSKSLLLNLFKLVYKSTEEFDETIQLLVKMSFLYRIADERYITYRIIQNELKLDYEFRLEAKNLLVDVLIRILNENKKSDFDVEVCFKQTYEIFKAKLESKFSENSHEYFRNFKQPVTKNYFFLLDKLTEINSGLIKCVELTALSRAQREIYISDTLKQDFNINDLLTSSFLLIKNEIEKAVELLEKGELIIYEHFSEIKRELQLSKELNVLEVKEINGFDVNDELENLPEQLVQEIDEIENEYQEIFEFLETYEADCTQVFQTNREAYFKKCKNYAKNLEYLKENWREHELAEMCANTPKSLNVSVAADIFYNELEREVTQKIRLTFFYKGKPVLVEDGKCRRGNSFKINLEKISLTRRDSKRYALRGLPDFVLDFFEKNT